MTDKGFWITTGKGPIVPKEAKTIGRDPGLGGQVIPATDEEWAKIGRIPVPELPARIYDKAKDETIGRYEEAYNAWLTKIYPRTPPEGAPRPTYTSDGVNMDDYMNMTAYKMLKDRALDEGYEIIELSAEEMLERFGYASDRSGKDRGKAGNYKGWEEGRAIYVDKEADELPLILAHEYVGKHYTANGREHAYHENEVQRDAKKLLDDLYRNLGRYSMSMN